MLFGGRECAVLKAIRDNPKIIQTGIAYTIKKYASTVKRITSALIEKKHPYTKERTAQRIVGDNLKLFICIDSDYDSLSQMETFVAFVIITVVIK